MSFLRVLRVAFHSLMRTQGLALIVILTLALGIGANAAIFTLVRGVLLKPLVNRDEDRLIYIRQSAPGAGDDNSTFSVPEIHDLRASVKTLSAFGEFSTIEFTMIGLGEPRVVQAGVVDGPFFEVMGLHPVLGRLVGRQDDGPKAAGVVVLTYRFWTTTLMKDPSVLGIFRMLVDTPVTLGLSGLQNGYPHGSFLWIINNIYFQYFSVLITLISAFVMVVVSYMTAEPDYATLQNLTFATKTKEDIAATRASWDWREVSASGFVLLCILGSYLYFRG